MAFHIKVPSSATRAVDGIEAGATKKARIKKADRPFQPPHIDVVLQPSRYGLAAKLMEHFARVRNEPPYAKEFGAFYRKQMLRKFSEQERLEIWLEKKRAEEAAGEQERFLRVRASELKSCSRMQTMRLMGFTPADIGLDSPHWGVSASAGEQLHLMIEIALRFLRLVKRAEFTVKTEANDLGGRVDAELLGSAFGAGVPDAIADIKTVGPDDYKEATWGKKVPGYIAQITAYARLTGNKVGVVLLVDRGSGRMMDFEWAIDEDQADALVARASNVVEQARSRRLPEAESFISGKPTFECFQFCPFSRLCFQQERDGSVQAALDAGADPQEM